MSQDARQAFDAWFKRYRAESNLNPERAAAMRAWMAAINWAQKQAMK
jgi:hypothetical protein